ncbi:MAG: hypothetical protein ACYTGN_01300 [Planctomycetota bacterium]
MIRAALIVALLAPGLCAGDETFEILEERWPAYSPGQKAAAVRRWAKKPSAGLLAAVERWLAAEKDPVAQGALVTALLEHNTSKPWRARVKRALERHMRARLKARAKRERDEFNALHRKLKRKLPPDTEIAAGRNWTDPYDETVRKPTPEILAERASMVEIVTAIEASNDRALLPVLLSVLAEHHDPAVLARIVAAFGARKDWKALLPMTDLARIQVVGREVGGSHVIGETRWNTMRLKWDVYKDQLWWSRPEYVPRVVRPTLQAANAITGAKVGSIRELDAWILANAALLKKHDVVVSDAFRHRASRSQG